MKIAVVGDVLLDSDIGGRADRLSPDAPVPVVAVQTAARRPGGAGLVATFLARDGVDVVLVTALSDDDAGRELRGLLAGISERSPGSIEIVAGRSPSATPIKTRVRVDDHAVVRIDEGCEAAAPPEVDAAMLAAVTGVDAVIAADYGRGLLSGAALRAAIEKAADLIPVVWDPHPRGAIPVPGVVVTPNLSEARAAAGIGSDGIAAASDSAARLIERWEAEAVLVTLGSRGALLHRRGDERGIAHVVPAVPIANADTCGAGDRLVASLASELASGSHLPAAVQSAVGVTGRFLADGGVASLNRGSTAAALAPSGDALAVARATRARGGTVVATGGCFDLLHAGHARTLASARALGDCLIVCLNSDRSVRRLKGAERPIMGQDDRTDLLLALSCVDAVIIFDESTPEAVLSRITPDIWVKGGDYVADELPETAVIAEWGGRTVTVPYHHGHSTTSLAGALARVG